MKKSKVILFDVDGVLIRLPNYFGEELERRGYKGVEEILNYYYKGIDNWDCLEGKAIAEERIMPYLKKFGWKGTGQEYFKQQFKFEKQFLDQSLVSQIKQFQSQEIRCYLATDNEKVRAKFLLDEMDFGNIFDGYFISSYIGYRKRDNQFWKYVIDKLKNEMKEIEPQEIVFFDDIQNNIDVAERFGIIAFLFTDEIQFERDIKRLEI
ncbi:hypothetical protein KAJ41_02785 [Candidatus Parcubacteria bacterium]|nr:hypothetical protein [Candidatus Parcubacteria bacterium]